VKDDEWSLAAVILRIAKATKRAQFKFRPGCFISHRESYEVGPDALEDYKQLPWRLLKFSGAYRWFSVTAVGIMVNQSLARLVDEQAAAEAASSELHSVLQTLSATPPEQTVLRALTGIKFPTRTRPLALAGLKIAPFTSRDRRRLMTQYRAYARSAISNPQGRRRYVAAMATDLDQWKEKTVMWSTHAAESTRAEELSLETAHQVCALFRYACMSLRTDSVEMAIGLGSVQSTDYLIIPKEGSIMSGGGSAGKNRSWTITYSERAAMHKAGVFVLSDLYKESNGDKAPPSTSFHAALLRALHWWISPSISSTMAQGCWL